MDVKEFKDLIEIENNQKNENNQKVGTREEILKSLKGLMISNGAIIFDKKKEKNKEEKFFKSCSGKETVNIIISGKTGVGKSSLINYIFGKEVAKIGVGMPVTQEIKCYHLEKDNVNLYDTKGIEAEDYEQTLANIQDFLDEKQKSKDENAHIHIAWLCISEKSGRIETADVRLLDILENCGIPTIVVFTKRDTLKESKFVKKVIDEKMLEKSRAFVRVRNVKEMFEIDDEIVVLNPKGAQELLHETYKYISEGRQNAVKKAQTIILKERLETMAKEAADATNKYAFLAAGIGATPLPFPDSIALAALQTKMIIDINTIYRVDAGTHTFTDIAAALISITGIAQIGKLAANLLKIIPVIGWAANGAVAGSITGAIGLGYSEYLKNNVNNETGEIILDLDDLKENFLKYFNEFKNMKILNKNVK